jgi:spore maturation protein CgeB
VADFSPDLIFTVNHLGFDREGILIDFFHRLRLPSISWYADSPRIILNLYGGAASDLAYIFVWDRHYLQDARDLGFEQVYELPLGTDPDVFRPRQVSRLPRWQTNVSFVGNSMVGPTEKKLGRLPQTQEFKQLFQQLLAIFTRSPFQRLNQVLEQAQFTGHPALAKLSLEQWTDLEAGLIWTTTRDYRLERVKQLAFAQPAIYGDPGWRELLSPPFQLRPEVNYYDELPLVFSGSKINFNATSLQMKTAVNQRVFDVPAAGGFLLTDFRPQLDELFEIGSEVICYQTPEEIPDLVRFYLKHPAARRRIALKARQKVLQEHTYAHRIQAMLACLRRTL